MTTLENFVSPALTRALGWTLLHSLWQGALVAAILAGALLLLRRHRAQIRYAVAAGALGLVVVLAGITFELYFSNAEPAHDGILTSSVVQAQKAPIQMPLETLAAATGANRAAGALRAHSGRVAEAGHTDGRFAPSSIIRSLVERSPAAPSWLAMSLRYFDHHLPLLVVAWLLGLLAMTLRMLGGLLYVQRLRRYRVRPLSTVWQDRLEALATRSGLRRPVALLESALVQVPLVVGHIRPVILLPLGAVAGLPVAYLEAILAHELAHVLRRDYLVNLLQTVAEVLFFYHPAVWFVANCVRTERENCCDDAATALIGGDSLRLACALTALAEWSQNAVVATPPRLALAAIGGRGALLSRVRRLVQRRPAGPTLAEGIMAGALMLGGLGLLGSSVALAGPLARPVQKPRTTADQDTTKQRQTTAPTLQDSGVNTGRNTAQLPSEKKQAWGTSTPTGPDAQQEPAVMHRNEPQSSFGTVVITKDKKGRLTELVVNGQQVPEATAAPSRAERRAGRQVTEVPLPAARSNRTRTANDLKAIDEKRVEESNTTTNGSERKMNKSATKPDKSAETHVHVKSNSGRRRSDDDGHIHIDIDERALNRLVDDALALGSVGVNVGLHAAAQGLEEARRELERELRDPKLSATARREAKQALLEVKRERAKLRHREEPEAREQRETEARVEAAHERVEELRERRQEIQERIREAQDELRDLEENRREGEEFPPVPPTPPAPRAPRAVRPPLPPAPPRAPADNSGKVRDELRRDGVIGKNEKNFQFELSDEGLRVNGQRQPAELAAKYRKLLAQPSPSTKRAGKSTSTTTISEQGN